MTEPSRLSPGSDRTEGEGPGALDPTLVRPDGSFALPPLPGEVNFGPPEQDGDLGKLGRYRVLKKLGEGGMGAVYLGADTVLTRRVALKVMLPQYAADPEARERFLREARAAAMVHSDHVVTIHDVGEERGIPFIAMEHLLGYPLDRFLRTQGNPSLANVIRIGRETALGLLAAHKLGLIHRDIKPGNVWLEAPKGRVKILDFGLARAADDDTHLTTSGLVVGTPAFMSPEQARNLKLDPRSDLFSLGVMLYRLATGKMPFEGGTTMAVLTSLAVDTPAPPRRVKPTVSAGLDAVITKLLAKNPDDRYQTAREVVDALVALERQKPAAGQPPVDAAPMAIATQYAVAEDDEDESGSRARVITETVETKPERKRPAPKKPTRGPVRWLVPVCAVAVLALAALVLWPSKGALVVESDDPGAEVVIKSDGAVRSRTGPGEVRLRAGSYTVELADPKPGLKLAPDRVEVASHTPARVRVTREPQPPPPPPVDVNRRAAEYVLSIGGVVRVNNSLQNVTRREELKPEPFRLAAAHLSLNKRVTDEGLSAFAGVPALGELILDRTPVTDAGLKHFRGCTTLNRLDLGAAAITDAGLENFKGCTDLATLSLHGSDQVGDAGVRHFKDCKALTYLRLSGTKVTDAGLAHFKGCKALNTLVLTDTEVGDTGLAYFKDCPNLTNVDVSRTRVSPGAVVLFRLARPNCQIQHNNPKPPK